MKKIIFYLLYLLLKNLPGSYYIDRFRGYLYSYFFRGSCKNLRVGRAVNIANPNNIEIYDDVTINAETYLIASQEKIIILDNVLIGPRCFIQTQNHNYKCKAKLIKDQGSISRSIKIEEDCWIAYGVTILPSVKIGKGSIIGACSVVTKNTSDYSVNVGIPSHKIGERV
ncbi:MAG: acyltransferase [Desulforegulaceae bacterium]|jgi:maltose O-acetyltransferase|nr:acyltransferase [Desulforegulaceae bacterium]